MSDEIFHQCELSRGTDRTVGWIPQRGAKVGAVVELAEDGYKTWLVTSVSQETKTASQLRFHRNANKHASLGE